MLDPEGIEHKDYMDRLDCLCKGGIGMSKLENSILEDIGMDIVAGTYKSS